ncbi:uncharacterized protein PHALS_09834 [Plasmopara halstedii]|uniref:Uncharacterized protein n=1 Tax=Plasmopara halstedii TaxID=4781 RepID=A0A0N7L4T8_PLAHL|nr:uncharacterized protein PHALS_09834 [Plasmopara halstedii]CEG39595.1 hypothetical protein PHALS_09834 [Plasmopara halstedii]|eukprot:XP_024575964.1 hypothetical protein PHALS_09834 [Plasmopara halstedii]
MLLHDKYSLLMCSPCKAAKFLEGGISMIDCSPSSHRAGTLNTEGKAERVSHNE